MLKLELKLQIRILHHFLQLLHGTGWEAPLQVLIIHMTNIMASILV